MAITADGNKSFLNFCFLSSAAFSFLYSSIAVSEESCEFLYKIP